MALLTALFAFIGRQLSTIVQAILGWSVTALFGRLPSMKQTALSIALLVSLLWPVAVVGIFFPAVSAWAFAMLPLQKWVGPGIVRWGTVVLVVVLPLAVGGITRWVTPAPKAPVWRVLLSGYPLTLGYATACLVTAVTVPLIKLSSTLRGWYDEHVFVQPRAGEYDEALHELVRACEAAGVPVTVETVPLSMRIASSVLKKMAKGAINAIVSEEPKMLRGDGVELYLYPADLLLRGKHADVAHVRAAMTRSWLERFAFTVSDPPAQALQQRLQELWKTAYRHGDSTKAKVELEAPLRAFSAELNRAAVPFDQWVILDHSLHRLEELVAGTAIDRTGDDVAAQDVRDGKGAREAAKDASAKARTTEERPMEEKSSAAIETAEARPESTGGNASVELVRKALDDTRKLVTLEVALARQEMEAQLGKAKVAAIAFGSACALLLMSLTTFLVAGCLFADNPPLAAIAGAALALSISIVVGIVGWSKLPKAPLAETRNRIEADFSQLKEGVGFPVSQNPASR